MRNFLVFLTSFWLGANPALTTARIAMDREIRADVAAFRGKVYVYAKNLDTGETYGIREDDRVRTASTIKLPIMITVFDEIEQERAKWTDVLPITTEGKVSGSGVVREMSAGLRLPIRDLVHLMIVVSDNTATNMLLDRFPADLVNDEMDKLGFPTTRAMRKILGDGTDLSPVSGVSRAGADPENQKYGIGMSTPRDMVRMLELIERGEMLNPEASRTMIAILKRQQFKDGIGRHLPDAQVASKSGSLDRLRSDVGIVYAKGGRLAIAITCDDMPVIDYSPDNPGNILISKLTASLLKGLIRNPIVPPTRRVYHR